MVNKTINAITKSLHQKFGDTHRYYVEDVEQNLVKPCFLVDVLIPLQRSVNATSYYRTMPCVIHYFTKEKIKTKADCYAIAEDILDALEYITIDGRLIRGENISYQLVEGVLQLFSTYNMWTEKVTTTETDMEDVDYQQSNIE